MGSKETPILSLNIVLPDNHVQGMLLLFEQITVLIFMSKGGQGNNLGVRDEVHFLLILVIFLPQLRLSFENKNIQGAQTQLSLLTYLHP